MPIKINWAQPKTKPDKNYPWSVRLHRNIYGEQIGKNADLVFAGGKERIDNIPISIAEKIAEERNLQAFRETCYASDI